MVNTERVYFSQNTTKMALKLNEAIDLQKLLIRELNQTKRDIIRASKKKGNTYELKKLIDRWFSLSNDLVSIKIAIRKANISKNIARDIYELSELQSLKNIYYEIGWDEEYDNTKQSIKRLEKEIEVANSLSDVNVKVESEIAKNKIR